jgi:hypothetical protein
MGLLGGGNSKWNADIKIDKAQHRRDIAGFRTSSRANHDNKKMAEDARRQARKDKRAESSSSSACLPIAVALTGGAAALLASIGVGISKLVS